jgi:hypothetical protein
LIASKTPLLNYLDADDLSNFEKVSKRAQAAVEAARGRYAPRVVMPPGYEDEWPVFGRYDRDIVHPLYVHLKSSERIAYEQSLAKYVDLAYRNMVSLVQRHHKDCDVRQEADELAESLSGNNPHWRKGNCVAVVVRKGALTRIALNALTKKGHPHLSLHPSALEALEESGAQFIDMTKPIYEHCEIRLWEQFGDVAGYIGIMQPCCLYCAAQLLSAGFTGFRGCHLQTYGKYVFSEKILSNPRYLRTLFGAYVLDWYVRLDAKGKLDFLDLLAVAKGVKVKLTKLKNKSSEDVGKGGGGGGGGGKEDPYKRRRV